MRSIGLGTEIGESGGCGFWPEGRRESIRKLECLGELCVGRRLALYKGEFCVGRLVYDGGLCEVSRLTLRKGESVYFCRFRTSD